VTAPLHIVSVCRSLPTPDDPSAGVFVLNRIAAMSKVADVRIVQPIPYMPAMRPLPGWAREPRHRVGDLELEHAPMAYIPGILKSLDPAWLARSIGPTIQRMHAARPIDAIDAHFGFPDGMGCVSVGRRLGIPVFITLRGFEQDRSRDVVIGPQLRAAMRAASGCVAVSETLRALALRSGVDAQAVQVIHNAIDATTFNSGDGPGDARRRLGLPADSKLIVSVGRLIALKRQHVLVDAFAAVRRELPQASLAIIGGRSLEPRYAAQLEAQIRARGLQSSVRLVGNLAQPDVADWLRAADAFALLSSREGCNNAVLEALAVGVPVVATPAGDNTVFVQSGINGEIVPVDDAPATARALSAVLQRQDWDRVAISRRVGAQVGNWGIVAERVLAFFRQRLAATACAAPQEGTPHASRAQGG
jgi:teichuronic acid biosynthesis glycosyltransferase TuaC